MWNYDDNTEKETKGFPKNKYYTLGTEGCRI
jgi:hypothetical protein